MFTFAELIKFFYIFQHQAYSFDYAVKDDYYYVDQGHYEKSDGHSVTGSYRVLLPDGRTQVNKTKKSFFFLIYYY